MRESLLNIPAEVVHNAVHQGYPDGVNITLEDCMLTDEDREKVFDTTHPAAAYRGFPLTQREILALEHAKERQQKEIAQATGHLALA